MHTTKDSIIGQVVAQNFKAAEVFKKHRIDFCCNGNRTIEDACNRKKINIDEVLGHLNAIEEKEYPDLDDLTSKDVSTIIAYILDNHHSYIKEKVPTLTAFVKKIAVVHGERHPELLEINNLWQGAVHDLLHHLSKEENVLFPYAQELEKSPQRNTPPFGTVANPIGMMHHEHDIEGERFRKIRELANDYTPPQDACTTYRVAFSMLEEFEDDLHKHIHIENNILFPKILELE